MFRLCLMTLVFAAVIAGCSGYATPDTWDEGPCPDPQQDCPMSPGAECRVMCWKVVGGGPEDKECLHQYFKNNERVVCWVY